MPLYRAPDTPPTEDELAALEDLAGRAPALRQVGGIDYIPAPRDVVPRLIAEIRRLRAENASLRDRYYDYDPSE